MYFCPDLVENYAKNSMKRARQKLIEECRYNLGPYRVLKMCLNKQFSPSPYFLCQCKSLKPGPHLCKASDWLPSYTPQSHRFTFKDKYLTLQTMTPLFPSCNLTWTPTCPQHLGNLFLQLNSSHWSPVKLSDFSALMVYLLFDSHGRWLPQQCILEDSNQSGQPFLAGIVSVCLKTPRETWTATSSLPLSKLSGEGGMEQEWQPCVSGEEIRVNTLLMIMQYSFWLSSLWSGVAAGNY